MGVSISTQSLNVRRSEPELVRPARPTPNNPELLSDLDSIRFLLYNQSIIWFYPNNKNKEPTRVIKKSLEEALVYYYPWAGRLRDPGLLQTRITVDCTAEGVVFVEADADISLQQIMKKGPLLPPFPNLDQLIYNKVASSKEMFDAPILTMQVTRLSCGGFILGVNFNHAMADGFGLVQLLTAMTDLAKGATTPSLLPVWQRSLLNGTNPIPHTNNNQNPLAQDDTTFVSRVFTFTPDDAETLRAHIPQPHTTTSFDLIMAALWRCRTIAFNLHPQQQVSAGFFCTARTNFIPQIPPGYYGNTFALATCVSTAATLCKEPYSYAVELVKKAKEIAKSEYEGSLIDPGIGRSRGFALNRSCSFLVTDLSRVGLLSVDFGWGKAVHCCPADLTPMNHVFSIIIPLRNEEGVDVRVVPISLPRDVMTRFHDELQTLLKD